MGPGIRIVVALLSVAILGGCQTQKSYVPDEGSTLGLVARLRPVGSPVIGTASVIDRGDGVALMVEMNGLAPGTYRLAFHQKAPCNSPNATSAGPAWAPTGATRPPATFLPTFFVNDNSNHVVTVHVPGVHVDEPNGLRGRTIVVHAGENIDVPYPGQPNSRLACGVFDYAKPLFGQ
jgi:Cu-Zn family superoxide dismutase